ncbi:MAG: aldo/keto reductase [Actinomycetes bacterium]
MSADAPVSSTVALPTGVRMPLIGLGTWQMRGAECRRAVGWALEAGYRHVDTATMYGNESQVGAGLRESGLAREDVFVTTKLLPDHVGRERRALDESLKALGTDHLDLWLVHWPPAGAGVDTWRAFVQAREEGLVRSIGVSNYSLDQVDTLVEATGVTPAVDQVRWSPLLYDRSFAEGLRARGVVLEGYSPFKGGSLRASAVTDIAARHGVTPSQVVVRWHVQHEAVVIPKSAHRDRIVSNADVAGLHLDADDMGTLDRLASVS